MIIGSSWVFLYVFPSVFYPQPGPIRKVHLDTRLKTTTKMDTEKCEDSHVYYEILCIKTDFVPIYNR